MLEIILIIIFLVLSAFFSSSETALFSLSKVYRKKLENSSSASQRYIATLLKKPKQLLTTILLGNTIANVAIASLSAVMAIEISKRNVIPETELQKARIELSKSFDVLETLKNEM